MSHASAKLSTGSTVSGRADLVASAVAIDRSMREEEREWVADLRQRGVKAAHPDDGWVDRQSNTVQFVYPQFNANPTVGDVIALGRPGKYRLVRVVEVTRTWLGAYLLYHFVEVTS